MAERIDRYEFVVSSRSVLLGNSMPYGDHVVEHHLELKHLSDGHWIEDDETGAGHVVGWGYFVEFRAWALDWEEMSDVADAMSGDLLTVIAVGEDHFGGSFHEKVYVLDRLELRGDYRGEFLGSWFVGEALQLLEGESDSALCLLLPGEPVEVLKGYWEETLGVKELPTDIRYGGSEAQPVVLWGTTRSIIQETIWV